MMKGFFPRLRNFLVVALLLQLRFALGIRWILHGILVMRVWILWYAFTISLNLRSGLSRSYFTNKSPYHETIDFDVHIAHFSYFDQHAKDEHFGLLLEQIGKLEEALYNNIQFEQHWLEAQTDCQAVVNEGMSRRAIHKALFESAAVIGASVLQVYILRHLFERKLGSSRI